MRFLNSLLLAIGCFALVLQSNAAGIPVKQTPIATEYRVAAHSIPDEALNDYHHSTTCSFRNSAAGKSFYEATVYLNTYACQHITGRVLNDHFHNIRLLLSEVHAKKFRSKLIFPEHYYW